MTEQKRPIVEPTLQHVPAYPTFLLPDRSELYMYYIRPQVRVFYPKLLLQHGYGPRVEGDIVDGSDQGAHEEDDGQQAYIRPLRAVFAAQPFFKIQGSQQQGCAYDRLRY